MSVAIQWFVNPAFDAPHLKSPQPCIHGAGCVYTKTLPDGKIVPAVCRYVHPGEEGKGRRLFPARTVTFEHPDGEHVVDQPACVRLIGGALYYERMRMGMPWQSFCSIRSIPFTANVAGQRHTPVKRVSIGGNSSVATAPKTAYAPETITASGVRVRKRQEGQFYANTTAVVKDCPVLPLKEAKNDKQLQDLITASVALAAQPQQLAAKAAAEAQMAQKSYETVTLEGSGMTFNVIHSDKRAASADAICVKLKPLYKRRAEDGSKAPILEYVDSVQQVQSVEKYTLKISAERDAELAELQRCIKDLESVD